MTHTEFLDALVCPTTHTALTLADDRKTLTSQDGVTYEVGDTGIVNMLYPKELLPEDAHEQYLYDQAFLRYDRGVSWVFETLNHSDEAATRQFMISLMELKPGMTALEVGAGTGKDSALILEKVKPGGTAVLSDLSPNMLKLAQDKLDTAEVNVHYFLGNGSYLPFKNDTFDAVFHFGGINTFSERKKPSMNSPAWCVPAAKWSSATRALPPGCAANPPTKPCLKPTHSSAPKYPWKTSRPMSRISSSITFSATPSTSWSTPSPKRPPRSTSTCPFRARILWTTGG